jgi:hypothetical protein
MVGKILKKKWRSDWLPDLHPALEAAMIVHAADTCCADFGYCVSICHAEALMEGRYRHGFFFVVFLGKEIISTGEIHFGEDDYTYAEVVLECGEFLSPILKRMKAK